MAHTKGTMFFSGPNTGWSESFFSAETNLAVVLTRLQSLAGLRAQLLGSGNSIIGLRASQVDPAGAAQVKAVAIPGTSGAARDAVFVAVQIVISAGTVNRRQFLLRGVPDATVTNGIYTGGGLFDAAMANYLNTLISQQWQLRVVDKSNEIFKVLSVDAAGLVTTLDPTGWAVNNRIKFFRTSDTLFRNVGGVYVVTAVPTTNTFQLLGWPAGRVVSFGQARKQVIGYLNITSYQIPGAVHSRKTGRPFGQPRGRVARRT